MRSILEKAFVALLNEEHDKAEELFHKFIVERARQIHESNRAGDDYVLDENWNDEITTESYFTEDDLTDIEGEGEGEDHAEGGEEMGGDEFGADAAGEEPAADEFGAEAGGEGDMDGMGEPDEHADETPEEQIEDLRDQLEKLTAEFEAMMDAIGDEGGMDDGEDAGEFGDEPKDDEFSGADDTETNDEMADHVEDDMDDAGEKPAMESDEGDEEYDDITESIIDELEKVTVSLDDGKEIGTGKGFTQNRGAAIPQKSKDARQGGAPIKVKQDAHKGFERETAPGVETMKPRRNNVSKANAALSRVSKEGDKSAEINKLSSENGNTKSPLEGQ
jgi:hypothetical protein